jgi:hypothetical protein
MKTIESNIEVGFIDFDPSSKTYWKNDSESFRIYVRRYAFKAGLKQTDIHEFKSNETLNHIEPSQYSFTSVSSLKLSQPHIFNGAGNVGRSPAMLPELKGQGGIL